MQNSAFIRTYLDRDLVVYKLAASTVMKFRLVDVYFHNLKNEMISTIYELNEQ